MTDYQKLVDILLDELPEDNPWRGKIKGLVETLLANGVTVQEKGRDCHWATEQAYKNGYGQGKKDALKKVVVRRKARLYWKPVRQGEWNLTCSACDSHLGCKEAASFCPECGARFVRPKAVMPEPPKGEA